MREVTPIFVVFENAIAMSILQYFCIFIPIFGSLYLLYTTCIYEFLFFVIVGNKNKSRYLMIVYFMSILKHFVKISCLFLNIFTLIIFVKYLFLTIIFEC